jgi:hypothetical protein
MTPEIIAKIEQNLITVGTGSVRAIHESPLLPCLKAFKIAEEFKIPLEEIGKWCNEHKIKICKCQLGCF